MTTDTTAHALGLHMHQPLENLRRLIDINEREAERIIRCCDLAQRCAHTHADAGRLHVSFSGVLLEQLLDPAIVDLYGRWVDIPAMLEGYRTTRNIEPVGTGYYHPVFPLIPREDWEDQIVRGRDVVERIFGRAPKGFWPPNMAFSVEMIPVLANAGYTYVVVDGVRVQSKDGVRDIYRPYRASHGGDSIVVVPRERRFSRDLETGMDLSRFLQEVANQIANAPRPHAPRLVTTWLDGQSSGGFRETQEPSGFFGRFFAPYAEEARKGAISIRPVLLGDHLQEHPPTEEAVVQTGAWSAGSAGSEFDPQTRSETQRRALAAVGQISSRYWHLANSGRPLPEPAKTALAQARTLILEGEGSCFLSRGDCWIPRLYERIGPAELLLREVEATIG